MCAYYVNAMFANKRNKSILNSVHPREYYCKTIKTAFKTRIQNKNYIGGDFQGFGVKLSLSYFKVHPDSVETIQHKCLRQYCFRYILLLTYYFYLKCKLKLSIEKSKIINKSVL